VLSLRLLLAYAGGGAPFYEDLTRTVDGESCIDGGAFEGRTYRRSNLPSDSLDRIQQRAAPLERDPAQPAHVRSAAHCVMNEWRVAKGLPTQLLLPNPQSALTLEYVCGRRFKIKNTLPYTVDVQYEEEGNPGRKRITLAQKAAEQAYGETDIDARTTRTLRVLLDGDVILTKANGGTTCP
jgi:hypothetical protein